MVDALVSGASAARRASSSLVPGTEIRGSGEGLNPLSLRKSIYGLRKRCGNSSVGRASASQAESRGFESRLPLIKCGRRDVSFAFFCVIRKKVRLSPDSLTRNFCLTMNIIVYCAYSPRIAAMPGSTLPSMASRRAPPPVDT